MQGMKVAWLVDPGNADGTLGGAELTMRAFADAAPDGIQIAESVEGLNQADVAVIGNCVTFGPDIIDGLRRCRVIRYFNDVDPHSNPELRDWLLKRATIVFTSPLHRDRFPHPVPDGVDVRLIPPPVDLERFRAAAEGASDRRGAVAVGPWMNPGKAPHLAAEWAQGNGGLDFYGGGPFAPPGSAQVPYEMLPAVLARYRTFVHLPTALEPFGRTAVEAWAAGLTVVTNRLVGARYWIEEAPEKLETAAADFWDLVLHA